MNWGHTDFQSVALPTELPRPKKLGLWLITAKIITQLFSLMKPFLLAYNPLWLRFNSFAFVLLWGCDLILSPLQDLFCHSHAGGNPRKLAGIAGIRLTHSATQPVIPAQPVPYLIRERESRWGWVGVRKACRDGTLLSF